ncbi:MAPEG family protein [Pseudacidovorax intermedius]|uniref:Glutathione metabolism protein n=1 Tax=Pseudacidovorax intermedius TaxID=433924 RepID=A0A147GT90_9BURK|nr:MAPEG family protein [Pseudacidovorax intermedius]KTT20869.1 glutathione metabolism protein [Pseudacidovorax intermedius]
MNASHLTVAYWCVLVAALLPYATAYIAKAGAFGRGDNEAPRDWAGQLSGWRARAMAAHSNGFESLPFFIGAVVIAHQYGAAQGRLDALAVAYVLLRLMFVSFYIRGRGTLRSAAFALALFVNIAILFVGR